MTNSTKSQKPGQGKWYENQALVLTLLGVAGTIVAALISISPQIFAAIQKPEPTQTIIPFTATVFSDPILSPTPTKTITPSPEIATLTPTETALPSPSPTQTPITPPISCLDRWQVISSDPDLVEESGQGDCALAGIPALGISASRAGISFGLNSFRNQGTFGISTPIPADATITLTVELTVLTQGEFWIALSNDPTPENNMAIIALQPKNGEVRTYSDQTNTFAGKYLWNKLISNTNLKSGPPYSYTIKFSVSGNRITPQIHFTNLPTQITNLPKYLFIGYNNKSTLGSVTLQVEVSNLTVDVQ